MPLGTLPNFWSRGCRYYIWLGRLDYKILPSAIAPALLYLLHPCSRVFCPAGRLRVQNGIVHVCTGVAEHTDVQKRPPGHLVKPFGSTPALGSAQFFTLWLQVLKMAGPAGFEPTHARIKTWCLTAWRRPIKSICKRHN